MISTDPWQSWAQTWRTGPVPDIDTLRREAARKRRRMQVFVALELATAAIASLIVLQALLRYRGDFATTLVLMCALILVIGVQCLALRMRRGTWRSVADTPSGWLHLSIRRARIALRLIAIQVWATLIGVLFATLFVIHQWLLDGSAEAHTRLLFLVAVNVVVNMIVMLPIVICAIWYAARQRRKIRDAQAMLRELGQ